MKKDKEQLKDAFEKALHQRNMYLEKYNNSNRIVKDGVKHLIENKIMPDRWYVRNPSRSVVDYLNNKYNMQYDLDVVKASGLGLGEIYGQIASVPPDVDYCWWITNKEFESLMKINLL